MDRLTKRKDFIKALSKYHKEYYIELASIFSLQQKMLELGICPRCGESSRRWSSQNGYFPCGNCGFKITENELNKVLDEEKPNKLILLRRLKERGKGNSS